MQQQVPLAKIFQLWSLNKGNDQRDLLSRSWACGKISPAAALVLVSTMQIVERPNHILEIPYDGKIENYGHVPLWTYLSAILCLRILHNITHISMLK